MLDHLERPSIVTASGFVRHLQYRLLSSQPRVLDGLVGTTRRRTLAEVVGKLGQVGCAGAALTLESQADPLMCVDAPAVTRGVVNSVAHDGVREGVVVRRRCDLVHHASLHGFVQDLHERGVADVARFASYPRPELLSHQRCHAQEAPATLGQAGEAGLHDLPDTLWHIDERGVHVGVPVPVVLPGDPGLDQVPSHLPQEEGVSASLTLKMLRELGRTLAELMAGETLEELQHLLTAESADSDARDVTSSTEVRKHAECLAPRLQLRRPVRHQDEQP